MSPLEKYLQRIGYLSSPRIDLQTLTELHVRHLRSIPYENLDVQLGCLPATNAEALIEKLISHRRGGWCYEMNGLFAWALEQIGFRLTRLSAGGMRETRGDGMIGNHLALIVHLSEDYLCDVGFAEGQREPIPLRVGQHSQPPFVYGLERVDEYWRFRNHAHAAVQSFDFRQETADTDALARMATWLSSAAESPFVNNALCFIHDADGISILRDRVLKRVDASGVSERMLNDRSEYRNTLVGVFGLDLSEGELVVLWNKIALRSEIASSEIVR